MVCKGEKHYKWKGGRSRATGGYVWVYAPLHPRRTVNNRVLEHRLVMEQHLGRYLTAEEIVHHKNNVRDDNRIRNLLLTTQSKHTSGHNKHRCWEFVSRIKQKIKASMFERDENGRFFKYNVKKKACCH